jgi:hypothetical protein
VYHKILREAILSGSSLIIIYNFMTNKFIWPKNIAQNHSADGLNLPHQQKAGLPDRLSYMGLFQMGW